MPISRNAFDKGIDTTKVAIVEFLENNPDQAFTAEEIAEGVNGVELKKLKQIMFNLQLEAMVTEGLLQKKILKLTGYYCVAPSK